MIQWTLAIWSLVPLPFLSFFFFPSAFSKSSLNICKFMVHILLKSGLENFEHYFANMWDECKCVVVWTFFGIAFLWDWNENLPFPGLWEIFFFFFYHDLSVTSVVISSSSSFNYLISSLVLAAALWPFLLKKSPNHLKLEKFKNEIRPSMKKESLEPGIGTTISYSMKLIVKHSFLFHSLHPVTNIIWFLDL